VRGVVLYVILCFTVCDVCCVGCGSLLSGFLRRLFLQVLLEDERVLVCVTAKQPMYKVQGGAGVAGRLQHPQLGIGHGHRCLSMSVHSTCGDVLAKVSGELFVYSLVYFSRMLSLYCLLAVISVWELVDHSAFWLFICTLKIFLLANSCWVAVVCWRLVGLRAWWHSLFLVFHARLLTHLSADI